MPALTMANQISLVKRIARTDSGYLTETDTDDVARRYINMGVEEFVKKGRGPSKENYIDVTPKFDTRTTWAIRLTITGGTNALAATDVAITATAENDASGTTVAADLETAIQAAGAASATVVWSTTTWRFTIDSIDGTDIEIGTPSGITYIDATEILFGKTGASGAQTWESLHPQDCTVMADLPSDFFSIEYVEWDKHPLKQAPFELFMSPETSSNYLDYYAIRGKQIFLAPSASERKLLKIRYRYLPAAVTLTGSSDTATCSLSTEFHMAPVFFAAGMVLKETFEFEESDKAFQAFYDQIQEYRLNEANQNTKMFPAGVTFQVPKVT